MSEIRTLDPMALKELVYSTASEMAAKGPSWAQDMVVLRAVGDRVAANGTLDLDTEQRILTAWHQLFHENKLSWGYNLDNPHYPFFHIPK